MKASKWPRLIASGLVHVLVAALLVGCVASGDNSAESRNTTGAGTIGQTLDYWLWVDNATDPTWQQLADAFNAEGGHGKVQLQFLPSAQYLDKLQVALASGSGPDAARMKDEWMGAFASAGALAPLSNRINSWPDKSSVLPNAWGWGKVPGNHEIYLMPHQTWAMYMYYNKELFQQAGLEPPKTQADVLAAAPKLTNNGHYAMDIRGGAGGQDQWAAWMYAGGAQFVNSNNAVVLENPVAEAVNQSYIDLGEYAPPGSVTAGLPQVQSNFLAGRTAMMMHHVGTLASVRKQFGDKVGVIPVPAADPSRPSTLESMQGNVIFSSSKNQDLAFQWTTWLLTESAMLKMSTSQLGQLPVTTSVSQNTAFTANPDYQVAIRAVSTAQRWPQLSGTTSVVNSIWSPTIQKAFAGEITSLQMLQTLAVGLSG